jgi:hypothetical protein
MTTTDRTLADLGRAWLEGEEGTGPPLHDALEEAGWPLKWRHEALRHSLLLSGYPRRLAAVWGYSQRPDLWGWTLCSAKMRPMECGTAHSLSAALAAAELALRRALRGERNVP